MERPSARSTTVTPTEHTGLNSTNLIANMEALNPKQQKCYETIVRLISEGKQFSPRSLSIDLGYSTDDFDGQGEAFQDLVNLEAKGWLKRRTHSGCARWELTAIK